MSKQPSRHMICFTALFPPCQVVKTVMQQQEDDLWSLHPVDEPLFLFFFMDVVCYILCIYRISCVYSYIPIQCLGGS